MKIVEGGVEHPLMKTGNGDEAEAAINVMWARVVS